MEHPLGRGDAQPPTLSSAALCPEDHKLPVLPGGGGNEHKQGLILPLLTHPTWPQHRRQMRVILPHPHFVQNILERGATAWHSKCPKSITRRLTQTNLLPAHLEAGFTLPAPAHLRLYTCANFKK